VHRAHEAIFSVPASRGANGAARVGTFNTSSPRTVTSLQFVAESWSEGLQGWPCCLSMRWKRCPQLRSNGRNDAPTRRYASCFENGLSNSRILDDTSVVTKCIWRVGVRIRIVVSSKRSQLGNTKQAELESKVYNGFNTRLECNGF